MARFELYITTVSGNIDRVVENVNRPEDWWPLHEAIEEQCHTITFEDNEGWRTSYATCNIESIKWRRLPDHECS
jgi:hypothetical protein